MCCAFNECDSGRIWLDMACYVNEYLLKAHCPYFSSLESAAMTAVLPLDKLKNSIVAYGWMAPDQLKSILLLRDVRTYIVDSIIDQIITLGWLHVSNTYTNGHSYQKYHHKTIQIYLNHHDTGYMWPSLHPARVYSIFTTFSCTWKERGRNRRREWGRRSKKRIVMTMCEARRNRKRQSGKFVREIRLIMTMSLDTRHGRKHAVTQVAEH